MPWWDTEPLRNRNEIEARRFFSQWQQMHRQRLRDAERFKEKQDSDGILGFFGNVVGKPLDLAGGLVTDAVGYGLQGLDWYDKNIVGNIWNEAVGPVTAGFFGKEFDDDWRYENLGTAQRFAAGLVSDPTTYLGGASVAGKALKGARFVGTPAEIAGRAAGFVDDVTSYPFRLAGRGVSKGGGAAARGLGGLLTRSELGQDIFRTLGRPTTDWLRRNSGIEARVLAAEVLKEQAGVADYSQIPYLGREAEGILDMAIREVEDWKLGKGPAPSLSKQMLYDYLHDEGGKLGRRALTKRMWEGFRRAAARTAHAAPGSHDLDFVDRVLRDVRASNFDPTHIRTATAQLATHAGNDELAQQIILGVADENEVSKLTQWVHDAARGLRVKGQEGKWWTGRSDPATSGWQDVVNDIGLSVENQVIQDIESSTKLARDYMKNIRLGPGVTADIGGLANSFDPYYKRFWTHGFDKYIIQPFQHLVLGFAFFPISNVIEESFQSLAGGHSVRAPWGLNFDEFMGIWQPLAHSYQLPSSLTTGARQSDELARMMGDEAARAREIVLKGGQTGKGGLYTDQGKTGLAFGGFALRKSNEWSSDRRRAYIIDKFNQYLEGELEDLTGINPNWGPISGNGWANRMLTEFNLGLARYGEGHAPEQIAQEIIQRATGPQQDLKRLDSLISSMGFHERAQDFLRNNRAALLNKGTRDATLRRAFELDQEDAALAWEAAPERILKWAQDNLADLKKASDPETFVESLVLLDDARTVVNRLHEHSAIRGRRLAMYQGPKAEHEWNAVQLPKIQNAIRRFEELAGNIMEEAAERLRKTGVLSDTGVSELDELRKLYKKQAQLWNLRNTEIRQLDKLLDGKSIATSSHTSVRAYRTAEEAVYNKYREKLDEVRLQIDALRGGPKSSWFKNYRPPEPPAPSGPPAPPSPAAGPSDSGVQLALPEDEISPTAPVAPTAAPTPEAPDPEFEALPPEIQAKVRAEQLRLPFGPTEANTPIPEPDWPPYQDAGIVPVEGMQAPENRATPFGFNEIDDLEFRINQAGPPAQEELRREIRKLKAQSRKAKVKKTDGEIYTEAVRNVANKLQSSKYAAGIQRRAARDIDLSRIDIGYGQDESGRMFSGIDIRDDITEWDTPDFTPAEGEPVRTIKPGDPEWLERTTRIDQRIREKQAELNRRISPTGTRHYTGGVLGDVQDRTANVVYLKHPETGEVKRVPWYEYEFEANELGKESLGGAYINWEEVSRDTYIDYLIETELPLIKEQFDALRTFDQRRKFIRSIYYREPDLFEALNRGLPPDIQGGAPEFEQLRLPGFEEAMNIESTAAQLAAETGASYEDASNSLWEMKSIMDGLRDRTSQADFLQRTASIFRGTNPAGVPWSDLIPVHDELLSRYKNFVASLDLLEEVPTVNPQVAQAIRNAAQEYAQRLSQRDPAEVKAIASKAWEAALNDYHKWFTNYDDGSTIHHVMRHIFPFWRYNYQRFPRLARTVKRHPWILTNQYRLIQADERGTIRIPGTSYRWNPAGGTYIGTLRALMANGGYSYSGFGSNWQRGLRLSRDLGFSPGPSVTAVTLMADRDAIQVGEEIPTALQQPLDLAAGYAGYIPGPGEAIAMGARDLSRMFPDRFREREIYAVLADKGIHPYEATPEQRAAAEAEVARNSFTGGFTGGMVSRRPEFEQKMKQDQLREAIANGVPEKVAMEAHRKGQNPLLAKDEKGQYYINLVTRRRLREQYPEWEMLAAIRSAFRDPDQQGQMRAEHIAREAIKKLEEQAEENLRPVYVAFANGEITGEQLRDARRQEFAKIQGAREALELSYPSEQNREDFDSDPREDRLAKGYWALEAPTDPRTGLPDFDRLERERAAFLTRNGVTAEELRYITEMWPRQQFADDPLMSRIEQARKEAADLMSQYMDIPKYPGMSKQESELAERGLELAERVQRAQPNLTFRQALGVVARYDQAAAMAARRALTIRRRMNPRMDQRRQFWDANPLLDAFYGS